MATFGFASQSNQEQTPGQKAAVAAKAAVQGLRAVVTTVAGDGVKKIEAQALIAIQKSTAATKVVVESAVTILAGIHSEIKTLRGEFAAKEFIVKLSDRQYKEVERTNRDYAKTFKSMGKNWSVFEKISNLVMNKEFESKAIGFQRASEIIYRGFHRIAEGINEIKAKPLFALAGAIATLGVAIWAFGEVVTAEAVVKTVVVLGTMSLIFRLLYGKETTNGLLKFSIGLAGLGLAIWAFGELVNYDTMAPVVVGLVTLSGALWLFTKIGGGKSTSLALIAAAAGIFVLGHAFKAFEGVTLEQAVITTAAVAGLGLALKMYGPGSLPAAIGMMAGALAIGVMGLALRAVPADLADKALPLLGFITGYGLILAGAGTIAPIIAAGAVVMGLAGASLMIMAVGMAAVSAAKIDNANIENFGSGLRTVGEAFLSLVGVKTPFIMMGVAAGLAIGAASIVAATGLALASALNINIDTLTNFGRGLAILGDSYYELGGPLKTPMILLGVTAGVGMSVATALIAGSFGILNSIKMPNDSKVDAFSYALNKIGEVYRDIGGGPIKVLKTMAGLAVAVGLAASTVMIADSINKIEKYEITEAKATNAASIVDRFLTPLGASMEANSSKFAAIASGVKATMGVGNMMIGLADGIQKMANLQFTEYTIRDGKLVPVRVSPLTDKHFAMVGSNIAKIISAISNPLAEVGSMKDEFSLFGIKVSNPFSNKVQKGVEAISGLSGALLPITELVKTFAESQINPNWSKSFVSSFTWIMQGVGRNLELLAKNPGVSNPEQTARTLAATQMLFREVKGLDPSSMEKSSRSIDGLASKVGKFKNEFNAIDLKKLTVFADMMKNMATLNNSSKMIEMIERLGIVAEKIGDMNMILEEIRDKESPSAPTQYAPAQINPFVSSPGYQPIAQQVQKEEGEQKLAILHTELKDILEKINRTLQSPLSVRPADEAIWKRALTNTR